MSPFVKDAFSSVSLATVCLGYCSEIWKAWRAGKDDARRDSNNPFVGGPMDLAQAGIQEVTLDGTPVKVHKLLRIRLNQLDESGLQAIGKAFGKDLALIRASGKSPKGDVVHPEFVETAEENFANSPVHLANNMATGGAVLDTVVSFGPKNETVWGLAAAVKSMLAGGDTQRAQILSIAARAAWVGRAVSEGSWRQSSDFVFWANLDQDAAKLDAYVVVPILTQFLADLEAGTFN